MKKCLLSFIIGLTLIHFNSAFAQQLPTPMPITMTGVVNFKSLSDYEKAHPVKLKKRFIEQAEDRDKDLVHTPGKVDSNAVTFNVTLPQNLSRSISPLPKIVFNGIVDNGSLIPPDVQAAAGLTYIVHTTNQEFDIFDKTGALTSTSAVTAFFSSGNVPSTFYSDPHVVYDVSRNRFVICILDILQDGDGGLAVAVSQTDDPTGNWYIYSFDDNINDNLDFLDYPLLGYNSKWITITGNLFLGSGPIVAQIDVFDKADLYSGTLGTVNTFTDNEISNTDAPALTFDTTEATEYLVADDDGNQGGIGYVYIGAITGTAASPVYTLTHELGVTSTWGETEIDATQNGTTGTITTDDTRVGDAVFRNGSLWFAHTVYLPSYAPTYSGVDWWQIDPAKPSVQQYGRISDPAGEIFYFYPSICVDTSNNVLLGYCTSSPSIFASAEYSFRAYTDEKNTMENGYIYQPGLASYYKTFGSGRNRFGDFSYTFIDPSNNSFWTNEEYAYTPANTWSTTMANVFGVPCNAKPIAGSVSASIDTLCGGESVSLNLSGYTSGVIGINFSWQQSSNSTTAWESATTGIGDGTSTYYATPPPSIIYYRCIVSCVNTLESDTSAPVKIVVPGVVSISTDIPDSQCMPGSFTITANTIGTPVSWYKSSTSGTPIASGDILNAYIYKDTTFYVSTGISKYETVGIPGNSGTGGYFNYTFEDGLTVDAITDFILDTVYVYASSTGNVVANLVDSATGITIKSDTITIAANEVRQKVAFPVFFNCYGGNSYNITAEGSTVDSLYRTTANTSYPYTIPNIMSITEASNGAVGHYYFFYDWHILGGCVSERLPVHVNFYSIPLVLTAVPDTICAGAGDSILLTVSGPATSFNWTNLNSSQTSIYVKPTTDSTFTVTATNAKGCSGTASINVYVPDCLAGVNTISANNSYLEIYPNPATGNFNLVMHNLPNRVYNICMYNMLSQKIIEKRVFVNSKQYLIQMDASALPGGVYFIQAVNGTQEWTQRFTKQ
jgi:hypothetical protein